MFVTTQIDYHGASVADVWSLVLDPLFRAAVCEATLAIEHQIDISLGDLGAAAVTVSRTMPAEVPDFVKRFVGETISLVQSEAWQPDDGSGTRRADLTVSVVGQPATMTGTIVLEETSSGVRETINGVLKVSVPFIGGRIEAEIAKGILAAARQEQETGRAWLSA